MKRSWSLALCLIAGGLAASLISCGPTEERSAEGGKGDSAKSVSFMVFGDPAELKAYQDLVAAFEKKVPNIKIELIHVPSQSDYRKRLGTDFAAGVPADVVLLNYRRYSEFANKDVLEPLGPYLAKSPVIQERDFFPEAIRPFRWKQVLIGIPQNISSLVVYYNKDIFDKAKLPYPANSWNWADFLATAKALTQDFDGDGKIDQYGLGTEASLQRLAPFVWQNGGEIATTTKPVGLTLHIDEAEEALQWFIDLRLKHGVVPTKEEEKSEDSDSRFQNGRTAMFLNSRRGVPTYRDIKTFDWDVAPLPKQKYAAGILHADGYFMPRTAKDKQSTWKFIEFANSTEGQTIVAKAGRTVPSLISVANSPAFLDPNKKPANSKLFLDSITYLREVPISPAWGEVETIATDEIERAFYGDAPLDEVLKAIIQRTFGQLEE
ncbi:MAG: sugar ABC transporter substrate-binding protein [Armatimonadetes bacterium]|nr:sugar ABC transporter substrate-binding protein [Armatimonadota bacterium]